MAYGRNYDRENKLTKVLTGRNYETAKFSEQVEFDGGSQHRKCCSGTNCQSQARAIPFYDDVRGHTALQQPLPDVQHMAGKKLAPSVSGTVLTSLESITASHYRAQKA